MRPARCDSPRSTLERIERDQWLTRRRVRGVFRMRSASLTLSSGVSSSRLAPIVGPDADAKNCQSPTRSSRRGSRHRRPNPRSRIGSQLHERAAEFAGLLSGSDRGRATNARELVGARLRGRSSRARWGLADRGARETDAVWRFLRSGVVTVLPIADHDLPELEALMRKYHDRPMDFADATWVHLAGREALSTVFTVDHDDFETYRIGARKRFRLLPSR